MAGKDVVVFQHAVGGIVIDVHKATRGTFVFSLLFSGDDVFIFVEAHCPVCTESVPCSHSLLLLEHAIKGPILYLSLQQPLLISLICL